VQVRLDELLGTHLLVGGVLAQLLYHAIVVGHVRGQNRRDHQPSHLPAMLKVERL